MTKLVKIGSSYGIRIPKVFIESLKLKERELDLRIVKNGLLLTPTKARAGWNSEQLRVRAEREQTEEALCEDFISQDLEGKDWEW